MGGVSDKIRDFDYGEPKPIEVISSLYKNLESSKKPIKTEKEYFSSAVNEELPDKN